MANVAAQSETEHESKYTSSRHKSLFLLKLPVSVGFMCAPPERTNLGSLPLVAIPGISTVALPKGHQSTMSNDSLLCFCVLLSSSLVGGRFAFEGPESRKI
jgi:hypothetical protein